MFTGAARLARITRVNCNTFHTVKQSLVFNLFTQVAKIPFAKFSPELLVSSFTCKSNTSKVFNSDTLTLLFSRLNNRFCNSVILLSAVFIKFLNVCYKLVSFFKRKMKVTFRQKFCLFFFNYKAIFNDFEKRHYFSIARKNPLILMLMSYIFAFSKIYFTIPVSYFVNKINNSFIRISDAYSKMYRCIIYFSDIRNCLTLEMRKAGAFLPSALRDQWVSCANIL